MPVTHIAVPFPQPIERLELAYLARFAQGCLDYLQYVRSGRLALAGGQQSFVAQAYASQIPSLVGALAALVSKQTFDAIIAAPSTRSLHLPYYAALQSQHGTRANPASSLTTLREQGTEYDACSCARRGRDWSSRRRTWPGTAPATT